MKYILYILMFLFATNLDIFLYNEGLFPFRPAYFLIPCFVGLAAISFNVKDYPYAMKTHTFRFLLIMALLAVIFATTGYASSEIVLTAITNGAITLLLYFYGLLVFSKTSIKTARIFFLVSLVVLALSLWYDLFIGLNKLNDEIRKGGFATNPNITASALKFMGLCLLLMYRNNKQMRLILLIVLISTIFLTFSRSGIIGILICITLLLLNQWKMPFSLSAQSSVGTLIKGGAILTLSYILLLNLANFIQQEIPAFTEGEAGKRVELLLGRSQSTNFVKDDSRAKGRQGLALSYLRHFTENPFGSGTGYTADKKINTKDTHNYYLKVAVEFGIIGLIVFLIYLFYSLRLAFRRNNFYYFVLFMMLLFECLISHGLFIEKPIILALAFMDSNLYFNNDINEIMES